MYVEYDARISELVLVILLMDACGAPFRTHLVGSCVELQREQRGSLETAGASKSASARFKLVLCIRQHEEVLGLVRKLRPLCGSLPPGPLPWNRYFPESADACAPRGNIGDCCCAAGPLSGKIS